MSSRRSAVAAVGAVVLTVTAVTVVGVAGVGVGAGPVAGDDLDASAGSGADPDRSSRVGVAPREADRAPDPNASVQIPDQVWEPPSGLAEEPLYVSSATLPEGGFVVVHDDSLLDGATVDSVVGVSEYLPPGDHEDVDVRLREELSGAAGPVVVVAAVHRDTDGDREFDFVASDGAVDGPYRLGGSRVTDAATVSVSTTVTPSPTAGSPAGTATATATPTRTRTDPETTGQGPSTVQPGIDGNEGGNGGTEGSRTDGGIGPGFGAGRTALVVVVVAVVLAGRSRR